MIAGTETTATALSGTTYHLLQNPTCMQKLVSEVRTAFSSFEDITLEGIARLKYLQAVLQEGLRMYPPVPSALFRRTPEGGAMICDRYVPGDVSVGVHQYANNRSPDLFRDAAEFHPERWLGDEKYKEDQKAQKARRRERKKAVCTLIVLFRGGMFTMRLPEAEKAGGAATELRRLYP